MNITLSQIPIDEMNVVLSLFKSSAEKINRKGVDHWQYWHNPPPEKVKWVEEGLRNNEFYSIHLNGEQVGMVRILDADLLYWGEQKETAKYIHSLVVKEQFNGQGIGKATLEKVADMAKSEGRKYVRLDCDSKNSNLCTYYERLGFTQVGTKELEISVYNLYQKEVE